MKRTLGLLVILLISLQSIAQTDTAKTITVDGIDRQYLVHLPLTFRSKLPVILAFHGGGGNYRQTVKFYNFNDLADEKHFIVVYPNAINKAWNIPEMGSRVKDIDTSVDDVHFISVLIDTLIADYKIDSTQIFATGISRGGMFSLYLAYKLPERIAGIAPVCASISKALAPDFTFAHPIPVMLMNGTADPLVKYDGGVGTFFNRADEDADKDDMMGTEALADKLAKINECDDNPDVNDLPDNDPTDGCTAVETIYSGKATVDFIGVINGGHTWPGGKQYLPKVIIGKVCRDFHAEDMITDFFVSIIKLQKKNGHK